MEEKQKQKLKEYSEKYKFWTEKTLMQFGYSINLFTTIGITFLTYLISIKSKHYHYGLEDCFIFSVIFTFLSVAYGLISVISRLYDFRLTRNITLSRKRYYREYQANPNSEMLDRSDKFRCVFLQVFKTVFQKTNFIEKHEENNKENFEQKFKNLQLESKILGDCSWKAHKIQIVFFLVGILFYAITIFNN